MDGIVAESEVMVRSCNYRRLVQRLYKGCLASRTLGCNGFLLCSSHETCLVEEAVVKRIIMERSYQMWRAHLTGLRRMADHPSSVVAPAPVVHH